MKAIVSAASGRSVSSSTTRASGVSRGGGALAGVGGQRLAVSPKATTRRPAAVSSSSLRGQPRRQGQRPGLGEDVGRAQHIGGAAGAVRERDAAPLPLRGEGHLGADPAGLAGVALGDRLQRPVAVTGAGGEAPQRGRADRRVDPLGELDPGQAQLAGGQGPGLVDADRVDRGQALAGAHLLDQRVASGQPHRRDREGDAHQQHQALGDQRHQARGRRLRGLSRPTLRMLRLKTRIAASGSIT